MSFSKVSKPWGMVVVFLVLAMSVLFDAVIMIVLVFTIEHD